MDHITLMMGGLGLATGLSLYAIIYIAVTSAVDFFTDSDS